METFLPCDISVVLCTYNRADRLPLALRALGAQTGNVPYEVVVVDNNSTDATAEIVRAAGRECDWVRYAFEPRQGLSDARNRGIRCARGRIVAFCDDDVRVAPDWVQTLRDTFAAHPEADYVGGRVLPHWPEPPPRWLTSAHWSPLALQDYGPEPFLSGREHAICLVGANVAFRRRVFARVGGFTPSLGRVKDGIGSTEDHDMQLRIWLTGMHGLYAPDLIVIADVPRERMVKAYHRRWHRAHGRYCAAMRLRELVPADMGPMTVPRDLVQLFGSPAFVYADLILFARRWARAMARREDPFFYANKLRHTWNYVRHRRRLYCQHATHGSMIEVMRFTAAYWRKKRRRLRAVAVS